MSFLQKIILFVSSFLLLGMLSSPLLAKKKISLSQTLDTRNEDCRVCVDCISSNESIELDFYGKYSGFNAPFFKSNNVKVRVYIQKGNKRIWQSSVLTPIRVKDTLVQGKPTSKYVILIRTQSLPKTGNNRDFLMVEVRNMANNNPNSLSSGSPYRQIQGAMEAYFSKGRCNAKKRCFTRPGCNTGPGSVSTGVITSRPTTTAVLATTKMVNLKAATLKPGRNLVYADRKSGKKVYAFVKKEGKSVRLTKMYMQNSSGKWIELSQAYKSVSKPSTWSCTRNWNGRVRVFSTPRMKGRVLYAKCNAGIMKFKVPINL